MYNHFSSQVSNLRNIYPVNQQGLHIVKYSKLAVSLDPAALHSAV